MDPATEKSSKPLSSPSTQGKTHNILAFSELDDRMQAVALTAIATINKKTRTEPGKTWERYTGQIEERLKTCVNAKNTLFIAQEGAKVIGYVAFYTRPDRVPYANAYIESEDEAYCSWTAVDEDYRGKGLAQDLKLQIFSREDKYNAFIGHIKKTNSASLRVLNKFAEQGFDVTSEEFGHQVFYRVRKKQ